VADAPGILRSGVKVVASAADLVRRPARGVVVLIYHRVGRRTASEIDLPADVFERQVAWLAATGRAMALADALEVLARPAGEAPDGDPVVVTFDDGTADVVDVAVPILERHRVPATLFLATDFVERGIAFPDDGRPTSWAALADAVATGVLAVGSHTHTHALLDRLPDDEVADELDRSIGLIGDRLGVEALDFAYPKAVAGSSPAAAQVRSRFRSASLGGCRPNPYSATDPHRLARSVIQLSDGWPWFTRKAAGGLALEEQLRGLLNRRRYVGVSS
jgi:peptidoglycan/xylan/chitin deacetylase (PgdA/CDA1 family)